jgi:hypothetical protein
MTTQSGMPSAILHNFYGVNRTKRTIQKKYNKKLFPFAFSASFFPQNPQNFTKQWANSQELPTSGRCARASTQKYLKQSKGK